MRIILAIVFFGALLGINIWAYLNNKKTPVPKGCENIRADCEGCKIMSCSLRQSASKIKEEM